MRSPHYAKIMFLFSCACALFAYGLAVGIYKVFPYSIVDHTITSVKHVIAEKETILGLRPTEFLELARYEGSGVTRLESEKMTPGLTFLTGFFDGGNEMRLIRQDGTVVNRWPVRFFDIFPDPEKHVPKQEVPKSEWYVEIHGSLLLPDGSVVFNFQRLGTAKIDRCGRVLWRVGRFTHHSVDQSSDGGFWIPDFRVINTSSRYPHLKPTYLEDTIIKVSADGEVVKDLSLLEILFRNNLQGMAYTSALSGDITHLNDVEELSAEMAASFPQFEAGDLLISAKFPNLVLVADPETLEVKWYQVGPWIGQHDPDFLSTGSISVFSNNNRAWSNESLYGGTSIMEVDPADRGIRVRYGGKAEEPMFTKDRGKHQRLGEDGRGILITETRGGRVFEVNKDNEVVWEYISRYDDEQVLVVNGALRYPEDYFTVTDWSCPQPGP